jgi:hypothetical protein
MTGTQCVCRIAFALRLRLDATGAANMSSRVWKILATVIFSCVWSGGVRAQMLTYAAVEYSCQRRYTVDLAKGVCWGYISGLLDATILRLNTKGRRVICIDHDADKDKVVDRIFSYVEEPKDKQSAASVFLALAILAAFTCRVPGQ